jgi:SAM-dependent methyltransferase
MKIKHRASFLLSDCADIKLPDNSVDKALMRSVLVHILDKQAAINEIYRILKPGGEFVGFEPIINTNTKYWELTTQAQITDWEEFKNAENDFMSASDNPMTNFNQDTLARNLETAGFSDGVIDVDTTISRYDVNKDTIHSWLVTRPSPDEPNVYERFLKYFPHERVDRYCEELKEALNGKEVEIKTNTVFIKARK